MFVALKGSFSSENKSSFKRHFVIKHLLNHYSTNIFETIVLICSFFDIILLIKLIYLCRFIYLSIYLFCLYFILYTYTHYQVIKKGLIRFERLVRTKQQCPTAGVFLSGPNCN